MRLLAAAFAALAIAPVGLASGPGTEATLLGRAILASDAYQPGPVSGTVITPEQRRHTALPGPADPGLLRRARRRRRRVLRACRTTASARRRTPATSCFASTGSSLPSTSARDGSGEHRRARRSSSSTTRWARSRFRSSAPTVSSPGPTSTSSRCGARRTATSGSARSSGRSSSTPTRRQRPRGADSAARRPVAAEPVPAELRTPGTCRPAAASRAWRSPSTESGLYPILEGALRTDTNPRRRWVYEFDLGEKRVHRPHLDTTGWTPRSPDAVIGDFTALDKAPLRPHRARRRPGRRGAAEEALRDRPARRRRTPASSRRRLVLDLLSHPRPGGRLAAGPAR